MKRRRPPLTTSVFVTFAIVLAAVLLGRGDAIASRSAYIYPRFQPVSVAFVDALHGALAEDDWVCQKAHGCRGRLLATTDGGAAWRVTYVGARGMHLYPVQASDVIYAMTGNAMLRSTDAGLHWKRVGWPPGIVSFATTLTGWRLGPASTLAHPPQLFRTDDGGRHWTARVDPCSGDFGLPAALVFASTSRGWIVCNTQATAGYQGKEVWQTVDGGAHWTLKGRTHPIGPPRPNLQVGNLPGYGYPTGATFLDDGRGWLMQDRGNMLVTTDGGHTWRDSPLTKPDTIAAQSGELISDNLGYVLLRGCTVRLVRTTFAALSGKAVARWRSPTQCTS